ncbi:CASTOR/POLLUX-related putative ion channel [Rubrobacter indicoceani]|uniref:CASTOR/POLLUX-related putative ion channel n=1 Tax=Rubrobacter indicoceani TaxID=2051957 RepID=UPI0019695C96|nr:hypothetical protein [Rubrobacter indicoceani]
MIKTILALTSSPGRRREPYHIVSCIHDPANLGVAGIVGGDEAQVILVDRLIARITAQTCRQSGLSVVYTDLLDFEGDEIYFQEMPPELAGKTFREALFAYGSATVIGVFRGDEGVRINPPSDTELLFSDALILIAEDDSAIGTPESPEPLQERHIRHLEVNGRPPESTLVLGWNRRVPVMVRELDNYVAPGSRALLVADSPEAERQAGGLLDACENQKLVFRPGRTDNRKTLDSLDVPSYDHVIVLGSSDDLSPEEADTRTLMTLLHLREISDRCETPFSMVSEMLLVRNRKLAEVTRADDFIVSDRIVSLMMAQISENRHLATVFDELFRAEGSEIYLRPAPNYIDPEVGVNFATVIEAAHRRNELAIGYRLAAKARNPDQGVHLNPKKSEIVTLGENDRVIVLAGS